MSWSETQREYRRAYLQKWRKKNPEKVKEYEKRRDRSNRKNYPEQLRSWRKDSAKIRDALKNKPCLDCRRWFPPCVMDFDHRPGEVKISTVSKLWGHSKKAMVEEAKKCDLVCANCHRIRTYRRSHGKSE